MGLKIKDVAELMTKCAYSTSEVKELFALAKDNDDIINLAKSGMKPEEIKEIVELTNVASEDEENANSDVENDENVENQQEIAKNEKIIELEAKIAELQAKNVNQSVSPLNQTDEDIIDNALKELLD